ncbi:MAG: hypothetical protein QS2022_0530 [Candidatus Phytoplasma asteris]|nr:MAG: putative secreted protein with predicted NLS [Periwinkle leaf yellowing phytoplasma]WEX19343.1 MAG: hypothetical protein QS2022_0530 [Candidatus Phytoplasma asteris]
MNYKSFLKKHAFSIVISVLLALSLFLHGYNWWNAKKLKKKNKKFLLNVF